MIQNIITLFDNVKNNLKSGDPRSKSLNRSIFASFLIKGFSILISLLLVPITIKYVSATQYGIWLTLSSIVGWFTFFDIGFGNGLRNKFAEAKALNDFEKVKIYVSTTYAILTLVFSCVWVIFIVANFYIDWSLILNAPKGTSKDLMLLALIIISFFFLQLILKTINTILIADQRPATSAFTDMVGQLLILIFIIVLANTTHNGSLLYMGSILGIIPVIVLIVSSIWFYKNEYQYLAPSIKFVKFKYAKDILRLGLKFFIIQIASIVLYETSNIIIAHTNGPQSVTVYNIAFKYFSVATMIFSVIITPFWSAFTEASTKKDFAWMKRMMKQLRYVAFILMIVVFVMLSLSNTVYKLWLANLVTVNTSISFLLAVYVILNIWNSLYAILLNGMGKIKVQLYISIIVALLNIPLALTLGKRFGVEGVILSSVLLNLLSAIIAPIQVSKILTHSAKGIWNE